jgi:hypothetical protein
MKTILWLITVLGLCPVWIVSVASCLAAILGHQSSIKEPGLVAHQYVTNVFFEAGPIKLAIKPAVLAPVLVFVGSAVLLYGLARLDVQN